MKEKNAIFIILSNFAFYLNNILLLLFAHTYNAIFYTYTHTYIHIEVNLYLIYLSYIFLMHRGNEKKFMIFFFVSQIELTYFFLLILLLI